MILEIGVDPEHAGAEAKAPGLENPMNHSVAKIIDGHSGGGKWLHVLGIGEEASYIAFEEEPGNLLSSGGFHS